MITLPENVRYDENKLNCIIVAMKKLLAYYEFEGGSDCFYDCPLCSAVGLNADLKPNCSICPWVIEENIICEFFHRKNFIGFETNEYASIAIERQRRLNWFTSKRIPMLRKWIRDYQYLKNTMFV